MLECCKGLVLVYATESRGPIIEYCCRVRKDKVLCGLIIEETIEENKYLKIGRDATIYNEH